MAITLGDPKTASMIVRRFPDGVKVFEKGTNSAWLRAEKDVRKHIMDNWPVRTGLSRASFYYQRTPRVRGRSRGDFIVYNNVWYAKRVEERVGVVKDALTELRRRNWGANYVPVAVNWRKEATVEKDLRNYLRRSGKVIR